MNMALRPLRIRTPDQLGVSNWFVCTERLRGEFDILPALKREAFASNLR